MRTRDVIIRSAYIGLFGAAIVVGLTAWRAPAYLNWTLVVWQVLCPLACGGAVLLLDHLSKQTRGLPNVAAALAMVTAMMGVNIVLGRPLRDVLLCAMLGFVIGGLVGTLADRTHTLTLLVPFVTLIGAGIAGLQAWNAWALTPVVMWQMALIIVVPLLALTSLAPTREIASAGVISGFALLFAATWFWPVAALAHSSGDWRIPVWIWVLEGVGALAFLGLAWQGARHLWFVLAMERQLFVRQLEYLLNHFSPDQLVAFQKIYARVDVTWRASAIRAKVSLKTLGAWAHLIEHQQTEIGQDALNVLTEVAQTAQPKLRAALLRLFCESVQHEQVAVWQPCLDRLIELDQETALEACQQRLDALDPHPMYHFLPDAKLIHYKTGIWGLVKTAERVPSSGRAEIMAFIRQQAQSRALEKTAPAMVAQVTLEPSALQSLYEGPRSRRVALWRRVLADNPGLLTVLQAPLWALLASDEVGVEALSVLAEVAQTAQRKPRRALLRLFREGVQHKKVAVWQPCLDKLIKLDQGIALEVCQQRLDAHDPGPMYHFLPKSELPQYKTGMSALVEASAHVPSSVRDEFLGFAQREMHQRPVDWAATALIALVTLEPSALKLLYEGSRTHRVSVWRSALTDNPGLLTVIRTPLWALLASDKVGIEALSVLAEVTQIARGEPRKALLRLFQEGVQHEQVAVWQSCLDELIKLDQRMALGACRRRLDTNDPRPMYRFLPEAELAQYTAGVLALVKAATRVSPTVRADIVALAEAEAQNRPPERAAVALAALTSLKPEVVPQLYTTRRRDHITTYLLELAERNAKLRSQVITAFSMALQTDIPSDVASLRDWLFPFDVRLVEDEEALPHIEELVNEPRDRVTATHVTTWIYRKDGQISHLLLAGHANPPICKPISAKLFTTFLEYGDDKTGDTLMVPGAFLMPAPQTLGVKKVSRFMMQTFSPLDELVDQLKTVQETTGALQLREVDQVGYTEVCEGLRHEIAQAIQPGTPVLVCRSKPDMPSHAVVVPFYIIEGQELAPLSFKLDWDLFYGPQFADLLKAQRLELRHEMIADARRRKRIYEEWRMRDTDSMRRLTYQLFERVVPQVGLYELGSLAEFYVQALLKAPPKGLPPHLFDLPPQTRSSLMLKQSQQLRQFVEKRKPGLIRSDEQWNDLLKRVQDRENPVQGSRNYAEATVADSGKIAGYASLQELVEWNLPNLIHSDNEWIKRMDELLRKFDENDPQREARIDAINLGTLLDAFLRGWPPVFLPDEKTQDKYKTLCAEPREVVWRAIHNWLMERGMRMDPLQVDNVVFAVQKVSAQQVKVTPYYLTSDNAFMVLLHPRFGMTYYVNAWQYRHSLMVSDWEARDKRASCMTLCRAGEQVLTIGDIEAALTHFKQALRIHPAAAAEYLFTRFWATTNRATDAELKELMSLVKALNLFDQDRPRSVQRLERFVELYPDFMPDAYLLLGYHIHEPLTKVPHIKGELCMLQEEYKQLIASLQELEDRHNRKAESFVRIQDEYNKLFRSLRKDKVLIPEPTTPFAFTALPISISLQELEVLPVSYRQHLISLLETGQLSEDVFYRQLSKLLLKDQSALPQQPGMPVPVKALPENIYRRLFESLKETGELPNDTLNQHAPKYESSRQREGRYLKSPRNESDVRRLSRLQELQEKIQQGRQVMEELRPLREQIDDQAAELNSLRAKIVQVQNELAGARHEAWHSLQTNPNDQIKYAMRLNAQHVARVLVQGAFDLSQGYNTHVAPLHGLLKGKEYLIIESKLRRGIHTEDGNFIDQLKDSDRHNQRAILDKLCSLVDACLAVEHLEEQEISALSELRDLLERFEREVDSIAREMMIRHRIEDIGSDYVYRAYKLYNEVAPLVPEITEVRRQLSACQSLMCYYRHALQTLIGAPEIPIQNGFAHGSFNIVASDPLKVVSVVLDSESKTIQVISPAGQPQTVLEFEGLSAAECQHLASELAKPEYVTRLKASGLTPAYGILLTPIAVPPHTELWQEVLLDLEPWLIKVLAYIGISPVDTEVSQREKALAYFDHTPVIERVLVDPMDVCERFLDSIDPNHKIRRVEI